MGYRFLKASTIFSLISTGLLASAYGAHYVVQPHDTLSQISKRMIRGTVWGKRGSLGKLLALNPGLINNPNLIFPGQGLEVPGPTELSQTNAPARNPATEKEDNEEKQKIVVDPTPLVLQPLPSIPEAFGIISVEAGFNSTRFSATERDNGARATLLTKSSSTETFSYSQRWDNDFQTSVYFGLENLNINPPAAGGVIDDNSPSLHQFGITGEWKLGSRWSLGAGLGMNQVPFLTGVSANAVNLDLLYVPRFQIFSSYDFYKKGPFSLGLTGDVGISGPASTDIYRSSWNPDYGLTLFIRQDAFTWMNLETGVRGSYESENTSISDQSQTDLGVYLKLCFPLGGRFK